jgi:hypothetical protein
MTIVVSIVHPCIQQILNLLRTALWPVHAVL